MRVTKEERAAIESRAERLGYASVSDYIRTVIRQVAEQKRAV